MALTFGIFPVEMGVVDLQDEGIMNVAIIKGIKKGANFGVFYNDNLRSAAVIIDSDNVMPLDSVNILTKEQMNKETICSDFDINILEKRLS